ncbi:MAG: lasso peptide biosynthesis B2 protein [Acidobacteriota bacterium]
MLRGLILSSRLLWRRHPFERVSACLLWSGWVWFRVRWKTLPEVLNYLDRMPVRASVGGISPEAIAQTARAVVRRLPRFGIGECLLRSLVIYAMLRPQRWANISFVLGAGALDDQGRPALHCWIEVNGQPLLEKNNLPKGLRVLFCHRMPVLTT